ncbi:MAG: tRNA pseudouridine(55) synthase TruB [Chloroflexota bacterium]|nr:tRNA pseudouridine(55) synthase TruB [Chloroflexota bacterium]
MTNYQLPMTNYQLPMNNDEGILNLHKSRGPTSHDVVAGVRRLTGVRRVGHAGTLDPLATGVLLVCIGRRATRVSEYLMAGRKVYRARVRLGVATETYDAEGQVVAESPVEANRAQVEAALAQFRGQIAQLPPMYSAIKREGTPLYRLARRGISVEREPRQVEIFRLELTGWEPPECTLEMTCSRGTYVRSLAHDLGQTLGCGAYLAGLVRLASGGFRLEEAVTLDEFAQAAAEERWPDMLHPLDAALTHFPALHLDASSARRLCQGQAVANGEIANGEWRMANAEWRIANGEIANGEWRDGERRGGGLVRVYGPDEVFLALAVYDAEAEVWRPRKVFQQF